VNLSCAGSAPILEGGLALPWSCPRAGVNHSLRSCGSPFFETGAHVKALPALSRRVVAEGNLIGNHTFTHPQHSAGAHPFGRFGHLPRTVQADQIDSTTRVIVATTGQRPCFFRGPGGAHWTSTTLALSRSRGMSVVNWSNDPRDWNQPEHVSTSWQDRIYRGATSPRYDHAIVLMHDSKASPGRSKTFRGNTVAALTRVIRFYKAQGYTFTAVGRRF
jgi:peptidoglycan-N-acetylglucosamine deacetylase